MDPGLVSYHWPGVFVLCGEHMASVWCLEPPLLVICLSVHFPHLSSLDILLSVFPIYSLCVLCLLSDLCLMFQCVSVLPCLAVPRSVCFSNKYYPLRSSLYLIPQRHTWHLVQNHIPRETEMKRNYRKIHLLWICKFFREIIFLFILKSLTLLS